MSVVLAAQPMSPIAPYLSTESTTIADLLPRAAELFGTRPAIRHKHEGRWEDITYEELAGRAAAIGRGLLALGIAPGERVCVLGATRPEWTMTAFAIAMAGATLVPIYPTSSAAECEWVIGDSGAVAVVCEGAEEVARIGSVADRLPGLRQVIAIEPGAGALTLAELGERGAAIEPERLAERTAAIGPADALLIAYTSGTTGPPKGCVHTHGTYRAGLDTVRARRALRGTDELMYLFLPLSHVFALLIQMAACDVGAAVAYFGGDPQRVVPELSEVRPTYLPAVPRVFEKIFGAVTAGLDSEQLAEATVIGGRARDLTLAGEPLPDDLREPFERLDESLFAKVRAVFGGRLREAGSGAAPIAPEVLAFFWACGLPVMEGWGMTETAVAVTTSSPAHHRFGTVGRAVPGVELRIAGDGEILVRGANVFAGYHHNPEATATTIVDGWLHTGDLGELDADGFLRITGRKKDIIITAGGKNLAPANLENEMKQSRWISQAVMYGDRRPYPVMLVTLDPEEIVPWAREHNLPEEVAALAEHPAVRALVQEHLDRTNSHYARAEQVKRFTILGHGLSPETGELTPTLKLKRAVVSERYAELFESLYA